MLEQVLDFIHNYFIKGTYRGTFVVTDGELELDFLQDGQYFKICGSVFNDGVYQYPASGLTDETFDGEIWAMAVPPAVVALVAEIGEWVGKYGDAVSGPYQSESFGGYSYSKLSGGNGTGNTAYSWQDAFRSRLNHWRKI